MTGGIEPWSRSRRAGRDGRRNDHCRCRSTYRRTRLGSGGHNSDRNAHSLRHGLRLPNRLRTHWRTGRSGRSCCAATCLQRDRKAFRLAKFRVDIDIVFCVRGRARIELGRALIKKVPTGVNRKVRVWSSATIALDLCSWGRCDMMISMRYLSGPCVLRVTIQPNPIESVMLPPLMQKVDVFSVPLARICPSGSSPTGQAKEPVDEIVNSQPEQPLPRRSNPKLSLVKGIHIADAMLGSSTAAGFK